MIRQRELILACLVLSAIEVVAIFLHLAGAGAVALAVVYVAAGAAATTAVVGIVTTLRDIRTLRRRHAEAVARIEAARAASAPWGPEVDR